MWSRHSRRIEPISYSTWPSRQGDSAVAGRSHIGCWVFGDGEPNDLSSKALQDRKCMKPLESNRRRGEKIDRYDAGPMIAKERAPVLGGAA